MQVNICERIVIIILMAALFTGSLILFKKDRVGCKEIVIVKGGIEKRVTLRDVKKHHMEDRKININTARAEDLISIPSIGEVLAARIIEYRDLRGGFYDKKELLGVNGIGAKKLEKIEVYIIVS